MKNHRKVMNLVGIRFYDGMRNVHAEGIGKTYESCDEAHVPAHSSLLTSLLMY